jgi:hypothetical protein
MNSIDNVFSSEGLYADRSDEAAGGFLSNIKDSFSVSFGFGKSFKSVAKMDPDKAFKENIQNNKDVITTVLAKKNKDGKYMTTADANGKYKAIVTSKLETLSYTYAKNSRETKTMIYNFNGTALILLVASTLGVKKVEGAGGVKKKMWYLMYVAALKPNNKGNDASLVTIIAKVSFLGVDTKDKSI